MSQPVGTQPGRGTLGAAAVLVGVDGSPASRAAIALAAREAQYRDAPLIAVQAYSGERPLAAPATQLAATAPDPGDQRSEAGDEQREAERSLRDTIRDVLGDRAASVEVHAVLGLAGRKIVETAHKVNAQLIVLATHGSTSLLVGTVSQYVLRKAPCPVLIVPAQPARL